MTNIIFLDMTQQVKGESEIKLVGKIELYMCALSTNADYEVSVL